MYICKYVYIDKLIHAFVHLFKCGRGPRFRLSAEALLQFSTPDTFNSTTRHSKSQSPKPKHSTPHPRTQKHNSEP